MVNLCNGGTKDFVELWEVIHLKLWTRFCIRQMKLFWVNLKHYSQTCSNDHLFKITTLLRRPVLSPPKQIPIQSLLRKTTTWLMRPATTFFVSQTKTATKKLSDKEIQNKHKEQSIKNKHLSDYIYSIATL